MYFGASRATSIDLCVRDLVFASRRQHETGIYAAEIEDPFPDCTFVPFPSHGSPSTYQRANFIAARAKALKPDVIVVQQHLSTAAAIAMRVPGIKVILHTHNFQKTYESSAGITAWLKRSIKKYRYNRLAGIIHVSQACEKAFIRDWPELSLPSCVINNGLDFSGWRPATERKNEIVYAGRCAPEKGVLELAEGIRPVLSAHPSWSARFILSAPDSHPDYLGKVRKAVAELGEQAVIEIQRPFDAVKNAFENASIAVVPSICSESFGRAALEAHAGGAALISSGTGGLAEVSGANALRLGSVAPVQIGNAVQTLITDQDLREKLAYDGMIRVRKLFDINQQADQFARFSRAVSGNGFNVHQLNPGMIEPFGSDR
ncbi:MAG: glycosyltransferase family 4 protein [Hyphomicrobiales bacterium]|nr:glycosyltransferase family 4 protein [Hyphomicrobiales bacterium]